MLKNQNEYFSETFLPSIKGPGHATEINKTWLKVSVEVFTFPQRVALSAIPPDN